MKKFNYFISFLIGIAMITIQSQNAQAWPTIEWDPEAAPCYQNGDIVSYGATCKIGYTHCVPNPCPKDTIKQ